MNLDPLFVLLSEISGVAVIVSEKITSKVLYANENFVSMVRKPLDEIIGQPALQYYANSKDRKTLLDTLAKQGYISNMEIRARRGDNTYLWSSLNVRESKLHSGEEVLIGIIEDISSKKQLVMLKNCVATQIFITMFKIIPEGPELVTAEPLLFAPKLEDTILHSIGMFYSVSLGQGGNYNTGLYGPLPVPEQPTYQGLAFAFFLKDSTIKEDRFKHRSYCYIVALIPDSFINYFTEREHITELFNDFINNYSEPSEVSLKDLKNLKNQLINTITAKE